MVHLVPYEARHFRGDYFRNWVYVCRVPHLFVPSAKGAGFDLAFRPIPVFFRYRDKLGRLLASISLASSIGV